MKRSGKRKRKSSYTSLRDAKRKISFWPTLEPIFSETIKNDPKCLTHFDSLSSADLYSAVCFDIRDNADAGNSAKRTSLVSSLKARTR